MIYSLDSNLTQRIDVIIIVLMALTKPTADTEENKRDI